MPGLDNPNKKISNLKPDSITEPDNDLLLIYTYRETLHNLWKKLIDYDWSELENESTVIKTAEEQLRETIKQLEELRNKPLGKTTPMEGILKAIKNALKELYRAKDLTKEENVQIISALPQDKYDKFESCRDYIELAMKLMPSRPIVSSLETPVTDKSLPDTGAATA